MLAILNQKEKKLLSLMTLKCFPGEESNSEPKAGLLSISGISSSSQPPKNSEKKVNNRERINRTRRFDQLLWKVHQLQKVSFGQVDLFQNVTEVVNLFVSIGIHLILPGFFMHDLVGFSLSSLCRISFLKLGKVGLLNSSSDWTGSTPN